MIVRIFLLWPLIGTVGPVGAAEFEPDSSKFPPHPAKLPARLENMRPGQIREKSGIRR
jgi:hypothetical protein